MCGTESGIRYIGDEMWNGIGRGVGDTRNLAKGRDIEPGMVCKGSGGGQRGKDAVKRGRDCTTINLLGNTKSTALLWLQATSCDRQWIPSLLS